MSSPLASAAAAASPRDLPSPFMPSPFMQEDIARSRALFSPALQSSSSAWHGDGIARLTPLAERTSPSSSAALSFFSSATSRSLKLSEYEAHRRTSCDRGSPYSVENLARWIAMHPEEVQPALTFLGTHIQFIQHADFQRDLEDAFRRFCSAIGTNFDDTTFFTIKDKSNDWVTKSLLPLAMHESHIFQDINHYGPKYCSYLSSRRPPANIVIIDDASYSGKQISGLIQKFKTTIAGSGHEKTPVFHVIAPYMTSKAQATIAAEGAQLYWQKRIPSLYELVSENKAHEEPLLKYYESTELKNHFSSDTGCGLTYFDHKIPNSTSFFAPIADTLIVAEGESSAKFRQAEFRIIQPFLPSYKEEELAVQRQIETMTAAMDAEGADCELAKCEKIIFVFKRFMIENPIDTANKFALKRYLEFMRKKLSEVFSEGLTPETQTAIRKILRDQNLSIGYCP
jgi:hypothetical protein